MQNDSGAPRAGLLTSAAHPLGSASAPLLRLAMRSVIVFLCAASVTAAQSSSPSDATSGGSVGSDSAVREEITVVAVSPLEGQGLDERRLPALARVLGDDQLAQAGASTLGESLDSTFGSVSSEETTGSPVQPTLRFRGFVASPLLGLPQGVAVYQNGVRINEPFGDTVQFDLIPEFALQRAQLLLGTDPVFGLNALGGSLAMRTKTGGTHEGLGLELLGGSYGRGAATVEWGARRGAWTTYLGARHFEDDGWRTASGSEIDQVVFDLGYRAERLAASFTWVGADTRINGNGPAPIELLAADRSAVFTFPDTTENEMQLLQGRLELELLENTTLEASVAWRELDRGTLNGDEADFEECEGDVPLGAPTNVLCDDDDVLVDLAGGFLTEDDAEGDGALNRTTTEAESLALTAQVTHTASLGGRASHLVAGVSADQADVDFGLTTELGSLTPDRSVAGSGRLAGFFGSAPDDLLSTSLRADKETWGLFVSETLSLTDRVHLSASARYNETSIDIDDRLGTSLDGSHDFERLNPSLGVVFETGEETQVFFRWGEASRAPTVAELSCADPEAPCRVPNAFVADPPLLQVVARSLELGGRGAWGVGDAEIHWGAAAYRTRNQDDILFIASTRLLGSGFFQNAGETLRTGLDLDLAGRTRRTSWSLSYGYLEATFETPLALPGDEEVNPAAVDDSVLVQPGDRLPGIPEHSLDARFTFQPTQRLRLAALGAASSSRVFVGDEGNDQDEVSGYAVFGLRASFELRPGLELFGRVDNLTGRDYETFGVLAEVELELREAPDAEDPRFLSPGAPRTFLAGLRFRR